MSAFFPAVQHEKLNNLFYNTNIKPSTTHKWCKFSECLGRQNCVVF